VIPWNVCTAAVGWWILSTAPPIRAQSKSQWVLAAVLLVMPAGFYFGLVDHSLAFVLYSDNVPLGMITTDRGLEPLARWGSFRVPFPHTQRLFQQYFALTARPGWKMHIADPRPLVADAYLLMDAEGQVQAIDRERFRSAESGEVAGIECDSPRSMFALSQAGARMLKRSADAMIYAVEIRPENYSAQLLSHLRGLPNLEQLQLQGCPVTDDDLRLLEGCDNLNGIGLENTNVTEAGFKVLQGWHIHAVGRTGS
jgi:hypothetical protein